VGVEGPMFCFDIWAEEVDMWVFVVVVVVVVVHGVNHRKTKFSQSIHDQIFYSLHHF
jgi:hypothetical protein